MSHPDQREGTGPSPQVGKLRHSCTSPSCCLHHLGPSPGRAQRAPPRPTANLPSPSGCTHIAGQGLHLGTPAGLGAMVAGAAPAGRDERTGKDRALPGDWQGPGGRPRRLAPFPSDPGSSAASAHPAKALMVQGCSGSGYALGAGMLSQGPAFHPAAPTPAPQHPPCPAQGCRCTPQTAEPQAEGCEPGRPAQHVPDPVVPCPSPPLCMPWAWGGLVRYFREAG